MSSTTSSTTSPPKVSTSSAAKPTTPTSSTKPTLTRTVSTLDPTPLVDTIADTSFASNSDNRQQRLTWNRDTEELLADWGDLASCYKWMHESAFRKYNKINWYMSIPIIILSTITGTVSVGMASLVPAEYVNMAQQVVGGVNIITGIITTLQNFFRFAQMSEGHFNASVGWNKLERNIRIELKYARRNRKEADGFIKMCRQDYDRLLEQSPVIPKEIIALFKHTFGKSEDLVIPDICDNLSHTEVTLPTPIATPAIVPVTPAPLQPIVNDVSQEVLQQIKDILAESRIVPVGYKDSEIPFTTNRRPSIQSFEASLHPTGGNERRTIDGHIIRPRRSFLGVPPPPIKIETQQKVSDLRRKFNADVSASPLAQSIAAVHQAITQRRSESKSTTVLSSADPTELVLDTLDVIPKPKDTLGAVEMVVHPLSPLQIIVEDAVPTVSSVTSPPLITYDTEEVVVAPLVVASTEEEEPKTPQVTVEIAPSVEVQSPSPSPSFSPSPAPQEPVVPPSVPVEPEVKKAPLTDLQDLV